MKGEPGDASATGAKGDQGDRRAMGQKGEMSEKEMAGEDGVNGSPGNPGVAGAKGEPGDRGNRGPRGDAGQKGEMGKSDKEATIEEQPMTGRRWKDGAAVLPKKTIDTCQQMFLGLDIDNQMFSIRGRLGYWTHKHTTTVQENEDLSIKN